MQSEAAAATDAFEDDLDEALEMAADLDAAEAEAAAAAALSSSRWLRIARRPSLRQPGGLAAASSGDQAARTSTKRQLTLLPSVFEGRPPILLFTYTLACGAKQRPLTRAIPVMEDSPRMFYSHTEAVHQYNAVINILRQGGLYRVKQDTNRWHVLWSTHPSSEQLKCLGPLQKTNHFPGSWHLGRKDLIWRNIARMQKLFREPYHITPPGYILPKAFPAWDAARSRQPDMLWIWKPCSQSCGRGIKVLSSNLSKEQVREISRKRGIIQRYIPNPLLIDGVKFDMRIYVVVISYDPLKLYINDEGLVRFATEKYSTNVDTLESRMMHLTNYSVNRTSPAFVQNKDGRAATDPEETSQKASRGEEEGEDEDGDEPRASKWSLSELRQHFEKEGLDYDAMSDGIKDLVIKTLIAVETPLEVEWSKSLDEEDQGWCAHGPGAANRSSCFEIYGFDVLVDANLKPWLLEVNICPSLSSGSPLDKRIKTKLVADTMTLIGVRAPASIWQRCSGSVVWPSSDVVGCAATEDIEVAPGGNLTKEESCQRAEKLAACKTPAEALGSFDELAWGIILDCHDEDMRSGGLEMIHPTPKGSTYAPFFAKESYHNLVLRKWQEAGGGELFTNKSKLSRLLPSWVPRQVCFERA